MAKETTNYSEKISKILDKLPDYVYMFVYNHGKADAYLTKFEYSRDLSDFFRFLVDYLPQNAGKTKKEITYSDLNNLKPDNINQYLVQIQTGYDTIKDEKPVHIKGVKQTTAKRRRATLSAFFGYLQKNDRISRNPVSLTDTITIEDKDPIYLTNDEQKILLDAVRYGIGLPDHAAKLHKNYELRDTALFLLLLDTGLRVSEMLFSNISDYDLDDCSVVVIRKGGKVDTVYYSDECAMLLSEYFESQKIKYMVDKKEIPAFTTTTGERLGVRAVEILVKKYVEICLPNKAKIISPHKLRSSFAMSFYAASNKDILLLQKRMNHKSITTTNIYAKASNTEVKESRNLLQNIRE